MRCGDYLFVANNLVDFELPGTLGVVQVYKVWSQQKNKKGHYPWLDKTEYLSDCERSENLNFVYACATDLDQENTIQDRLQLHSIEIKKYFFIKEKSIKNLPLQKFNIEIQYLRRPNMLEDVEPREDIILATGDIVVILGLQVDLNLFEKYAITGK